MPRLRCSCLVSTGPTSSTGPRGSKRQFANSTLTSSNNRQPKGPSVTSALKMARKICSPCAGCCLPPPRVITLSRSRTKTKPWIVYTINSWRTRTSWSCSRRNRRTGAALLPPLVARLMTRITTRPRSETTSDMKTSEMSTRTAPALTSITCPCIQRTLPLWCLRIN